MGDILSDYFSNVFENLMETLNNPNEHIDKIVLTSIIIVIISIVHMLFKKLLRKYVHNPQYLSVYEKVLKIGINTILFICLLIIWIQAFNALIITLLIIGVFVVFIVKGLTSNIIGFIVIRFQRYFRIGHRVEINGIKGDVYKIGATNFELLEINNWLSSDAYTGRIIKLPNRIIFEEPIEMVGRSHTYIWKEVQYVLTFDSNWKDAEKIMKDAGTAYLHDTLLQELKEKNNHNPINEKNIKPVFSLDTNNDGIVVTLRYYVHYKNGTTVLTALQKRILTEFANNGNIEFAVQDIRILEK